MNGKLVNGFKKSIAVPHASAFRGDRAMYCARDARLLAGCRLDMAAMGGCGPTLSFRALQANSFILPTGPTARFSTSMST